MSLRRQRQCLRQWQRLCPVHMRQASGRGSLGAAQAALMGNGVIAFLLITGSAGV